MDRITHRNALIGLITGLATGPPDQSGGANRQVANA